jgi:hypothetical protein
MLNSIRRFEGRHVPLRRWFAPRTCLVLAQLRGLGRSQSGS